MNKFVALALAACLFTAVSAQNNTGNGTNLSWCRANTDCNQTQSLCCSANGALGYTQFNCNRHTNGTTTVGKCISNLTNDYTELCAGQAKVCLNSVNKATYCGGSIAMLPVEAFPNVDCTSSAYSLMMSVAFFAMIALSYF
jgi:hypothetical protein